MSRVCRLAAAALGVLAVLAMAPPASAAEPVVEWSRPSLDENVLRQSGPLTGTIAGDEAHTITGASFEIVADPPVDPGDPCSVDPIDNIVYDGVNSTERFEIDIHFPCNGVYELVATVDYKEPLIAVDVTKTVESRPLRFSVAIPPAQVKGFEASYGETTKDVGLTWAPNSEVDLLGYFIERNPPGPEGFVRITPNLLGADMTSFTDPGIEDQHRYQVTAVRRGAQADSKLSGEPSRWVEAGPERPEPTLPDLPPPNSETPSRSASGAGESDGGNPTRSSTPSRSRSGSNVFEDTLPFDPSRTTVPAAAVDPPQDAAVLAEFDDASTDDDRRATLVPIAGGLALVVGAMHLFLLSKRAGESPDIPMSSR